MKLIGIQILILLLLFSSCLPEQATRTTTLDENSSLSSDTTNTTTDSTSNSTNQFTEKVNFFQKNGERTTATLSLTSDYDDSFLIRGNDIFSFLTDITKTYQGSFCLVSHFTTASGSTAKQLLITSARIRSYYSSFLNTKEYFLQLEPNNKTINQNDCLTVALTQKLQTVYGTANFAFAIEDVCPDCTVAVSSQNTKLYDIYAVEKTQSALVSHLNLRVSPAIGSEAGDSPICSNNTTCTGIGYNCCLEGQCVNHGSVRSSVDTSSDNYKIAYQIVSDRPELINNFADIFYVCPMMVPEDGDEDEDEVDPEQQASDLFTELTNIYNCLNPIVDEVSVCTLDFDDADSLIGSSSYNFSTETDDLNFTSLNANMSSNNIVQIDYGNITIFKEAILEDDEVVSLPSSITLTGSNDSLSTSQTATVSTSLPTGATNDTLTLYFKIDGSCEKLGTSLARCSKTYVQGQSTTPARPSDHTSGSQSFKIPSYADTSFNVVVEVGGTTVSSGDDTWELSGNSVVFDSSEYPIYDNQEVVITYFVSSNVDLLTKTKELAQSALDVHCACDPNKDPCNLTPIETEVNGVATVTSYECKYPETIVDGPLQETVYVSAKAVPHKFYDENGVNFDLGDESTTSEQELTAFEYDGGSELKPNNVDSFIGFNEIYGTMNVDGSSPLPPKVVNVDKGTQYDIFVDTGAFSTCLDCGSDYFSGLQKLFPNVFDKLGGGYTPDYVESRRTTNAGKYPGDDFRFGRACFVPATMIPWTHTPGTDVTDQRRNRLEAQHILFSNGYNKDWYGFDYGALIGSFDGVKWFAIGNQRRIKADSNKLYLAVNAYFGDLTINNSYKVTISEMAAVVNSGSLVTHDMDSDGAECQKMHICDSDEDCITQLGYDYTCQNVGSMKTPWPMFDSNGNEVVGSKLTSLLSLVGGSNGESKRCVYRGVGAICEQLPQNADADTSYLGQAKTALHTCSPNSQCAAINDTKFNTKIARYGQSPKNQNAQTFITDKTDTFGLAARVLGRPYEYYGNESIPTSTRSILQTNNIEGLCVPGKDVDNASTTQQLNYYSNSDREADKINNVGRTLASSIQQDPYYYSACPATDEDGNFTHFDNVSLDDNSHQPYAIKNNLSTNALDLDALSSKKLFNDESSIVSAIGYHKNTCLRAPGAKCFSDFECAPNSFIANKFKSVSNFNGEISEAEEKFWEESLVCANSQERYSNGSIYPNEYYELYEHRCCRETDNDFTFYSQPHLNSDFRLQDDSGTPQVPGVNIDLNSSERYSRIHTIYDKLATEPDDYPNLIVSAVQPSTTLALTSDTVAQYKTLHLHNERMCCTGHWVRNYSSGSNGNSGGHKQAPTALQSFDISIFRELSWAPNNDPALNNLPSYTPIPYACQEEDFQTSDCEVRNILEGSTFEKTYLTWLGKLELLGIPQVLIETNNSVFKPVGDSQEDISANFTPIDNTIKDVNSDGTANVTLNGVNYYSAADYDNFEIGSGKLKKVFSENEFHCCLPTGVEVPSDTTDTACCTGKVAANDEGVNRCCLEDFTDLTVYTNRYVSSEGAYFGNQEIPDSAIDPMTGYIDSEEVMKMASTMCCSGKAATGVVLGDYFIPAPDENTQFAGSFTRRFLYNENLDDASEVGGGVTKFKAGLKWNDHVYCVPQSFTDSDTGNEGGGASGE